MFTIVLEEGIVVRDSDGVVVAPCQSREDPQFVYYQNWVNSGNKPRVVESRGEAIPDEGEAS